METKEICQKLNQFLDEINWGGKHYIDLSLFSQAADRLEELEAQNSLLRAEKKFQKTFYAQQPEWISVEDPPKEDGKYFTYSKAGNMIPSFYRKEENWWGYSYVTHWMPLPEPPKPKEPTFKDKFLEAFPKAQLYSDGIPIACRANIFGEKCLMKSKCVDCWSQPYFEEEEKEEEEKE